MKRVCGKASGPSNDDVGASAKYTHTHGKTKQILVVFAMAQLELLFYFPMLGLARG